MTPSERAEAENLLRAGERIEAVALKFGVSWHTIWNLRKAALAEQRKAG